MKVGLITGASGGIGSAIALELAENGYHLCLGYHSNEESAYRLKAQIEQTLYAHGLNIAVLPFRADVSDFKQAKAMVASCIDVFGHIDVLVNNAGISMYKLFTDMSESDWDKVMNVNLKSVFNMSQNVLISMLERKQGSIINISSIWGLTGASMEVAYSASKAGVDGLTKALAKELAPSNIRVNSIACGVIDTAMNSFSEEEMEVLTDKIALMRLGKPQEVAKVVAFLACDNSSFMTGEVLNLTGGHYC